MKKLWQKLVDLYDLVVNELWLFYIVNRYWKEGNENGKN